VENGGVGAREKCAERASVHTYPGTYVGSEYIALNSIHHTMYYSVDLRSTVNMGMTLSVAGSVEIQIKVLIKLFAVHEKPLSLTFLLFANSYIERHVRGPPRSVLDSKCRSSPNCTLVLCQPFSSSIIYALYCTLSLSDTLSD
jgi:hypothetical protein